MTLEYRRPAAASNRMMLSFFGLAAVGVYLIWSTKLDANPNHLWSAVGGVFLLWAAFTLYNVLRPVRLRMTKDEVFAQSAFGSHRFGWDALKWIDFTRPTDPAVLCYARAGSEKEGFVILSRKFTSDIERVDIMRFIMAQRPDVPQANPQPFVYLRKRTT